MGVKTVVHICSELCHEVDDAKVSLYCKVVEYLVQVHRIGVADYNNRVRDAIYVECESIHKKIHELFCVNSNILFGWEASLVEAEHLYEVYGYSLIDSDLNGTQNTSTKLTRRFVNSIKDKILIFRRDVIKSKMELKKLAKQKDEYMRMVNIDIRETIKVYVVCIHLSVLLI